MSLSSPEACQRFLKERSAQEVATRLRADQRTCREGGTPTLLAYFVPLAGSKESEEIIEHLMPKTDSYVPGELQKLQYVGIVEGITGYLANMQHADNDGGVNHAAFQQRLDDQDISDRKSESQGGKFSIGLPPAKVAADLLRKLQSQGLLAETDALPFILRSLDELHLTSKSFPKPQRRGMPYSPRFCYICRYSTFETHELYPSLCKPCGAFNIAEGDLSMPGNLDLTDKVALVTGGRVNLGFHTVLRLLRCGAMVIASTRYPQDAEVRYNAEKDSNTWKGRLHIIGADFRTAKDVFRLVGTTRRLLGSRKLFVLVNNAAQTLTDPIQAEQKAIASESKLRQLSIEDDKSAVVSNGYFPHVRGGSLMPGGLIEASKDEDEEAILEPFKSYSSVKTEPASTLAGGDTNGHHGSNGPDQSLIISNDQPLKSSWVQRIDEIPYEDIITAHSVNTFVPLILIRELLPLMVDPSTRRDNSRSRSIQPTAHIINVSSREGIFESNRRSREKPARHVHTNMTKAGLNMITETEADEAWTRHRIAMNSVDPGYMSAAPEMRRPGESLPLGFEDGAARVLWPVAIADGRTSKDIGPIYKRFLKHFGSEEVSVGLGR